MRVGKTEFVQISMYNSLRLSSYYELPKLAFSYDAFYSFLSFIESGSRPKGGIKDEDFGQAISLGGEQIGRDGAVNIEKLPYVSNDYYDEAKKGLICDNDILVCKDGALTGKTCMVNIDELPSDRVMVNEHVFAIRANARVRQKFLFYLMRSEIFYKQVLDFAYRKKAQPGLTLEHIRAMKLPEIPLIVQDAALECIRPYEKKISKLKKKRINIQEIIDQVFQKEFDYNYKEFSKLKSYRVYKTSIGKCSDNPDMRFSTKFHRRAGTFVEQELKSKTTAKIKDYLAEPIILGASISPKDYGEGDYYYISMATIKSWGFDSDNAALVNDEYSEQKKGKTVAKNDIIMARSGEGTIGKVALIEDDVNGIFADFTMRIRLKNYDPEFAYYYFRTTYFQYLIEVYKKGLGNNTNIFPIVLKEFPIPDIPLKKQRTLVIQIRKLHDKQKLIEQEIEKLQETIDRYVKSLLLGGAANLYIL